VLELELVPEWKRVVVVHQDERVTWLQGLEGLEDGGVLSRGGMIRTSSILVSGMACTLDDGNDQNPFSGPGG